VSDELKRTLAGVGIGLVLLVGLMLAAEVAPLAGLAVAPVLLATLVWAEGWTIRGAAGLAAVIILAFLVGRLSG
jgi:hypothetical protein